MKDNERLCFEMKDDLDKAVQFYLEGSLANVLVQQYGHPIGSWCISNISNFTSLFSMEQVLLANMFNEDLAKWDVLSATHMDYMFQGATNFDCDLCTWKISNLKSMQGMFQDCVSLHGGDLSSWDVSNVIDMGSLFKNAKAFNEAISFFNTLQVMEYMFAGAFAFNQDLSFWLVDNAVSMYWMFADAVLFKQDIFWDTRSV